MKQKITFLNTKRMPNSSYFYPKYALTIAICCFLFLLLFQNTQAQSCNFLTDGSEFQANTFTMDGQRLPSVGMDAAGNHFVAWLSQSDINRGYYAQRFDPNGNPIGDEIVLNSYTSFAGMMDMAMNLQGRAVAAWFGVDNTSTNGGGIYVRIFDESGVVQGAEFEVTTPLQTAIHPVVAIHESGNFVVAWTGFENIGRDVFARMYDKDGNPLTNSFQVNTTSIGYQGGSSTVYRTSIAMDKEGRFVIVWESYDQYGGTIDGIFAQRFDALGTPIGGEFQVNTSGLGSRAQPEVAMAPQGDFIISWDGVDSNIHAQRYDNNAIPIGAPFQVNTMTGNQHTYSSIGLLGDGKFIISYSSRYQDGDGNGIFAQLFDENALPIGSEFQVNTYTDSSQNFPDVAVSPCTGQVVITWESGEQDGSGFGIFGQRYTHDCFATLNLVTSQTDVSCANGTDGTATANVSGGIPPYAYLWNNGQTTATVSNLSAGTYSVTVSDVYNCSEQSAAILITEPPALTISIQAVDVSCAGGQDGSASANVMGGTPPYNYLWSNGQTNMVANGLIAGTYGVTATDANGCSIHASTTLSEPPLLIAVATPISNISCFGDNSGSAEVIATGGTMPYSYLWSDGQTTSLASGLLSGTHNMTVTDAQGCTATDVVTLTEPSELLVDAGSCQTVYFGYAPTECVDIAATAWGGVPPYAFAWSNGTTTASANVCPSVTTTYSVSVTDANNCVSVAEVTIPVIDVRCGKKNNKVLVCHVPSGNPANAHNICISPSAVANHLSGGGGHGGCYLGPCGTPDPCASSSGKTIEEVGAPIVFKAYPNPFGSTLFVELALPESTTVSLDLFDIRGKKLGEAWNIPIVQNQVQQVQLDLATIPNGIYYLRLHSLTGIVQTHKIVRSQ